VIFPDKCTEACAAMPACTVCGMPKHPRGRDPGIRAASGYCGYDCPGYGEKPEPGHVWPEEWREFVESKRAPGGGG
jgi:hypothetical protein